MAGNSLKMALNGFKWVEMTINCWKQLKKLEIAGNGWKLMEMAKYGCIWL